MDVQDCGFVWVYVSGTQQQLCTGDHERFARCVAPLISSSQCIARDPNPHAHLPEGAEVVPTFGYRSEHLCVSYEVVS